MHNSYMYVIANDGVDTSNSYPFKGKVDSGNLYIRKCSLFYDKSYNVTRYKWEDIGFVRGTKGL